MLWQKKKKIAGTQYKLKHHKNKRIQEQIKAIADIIKTAAAFLI